MRPTVWFGILSLSLSAACSNTGESEKTPECSVDTPCANGQTCLEIGVCAAPCGKDTDCDPTEQCSASGGCVAHARCGANADCGSGTICDSSGSCALPCSITGCGASATCADSGRCVESGSAAAPSSCGAELFQVTPVQANFLIVLDHSGSMREQVAGKSKWESAVSSLRNLTQARDADIRFGLQLFSTSTRQCDPGREYVAVGDHQASAIASALPANADGDRTPIGGALQVASGNVGLKDAQRSNNILLITDGKENCGGDPVREAGALLAQGVKTYVLGFGGEVDPQMLSDMATTGGTARAGNRKYYQADDATALDAAMKAIAQGAVGCDLKLAQPPPDPSKLYVYVDGNPQPRDPSKKNGWEYLASGQRILLYGATCSLVSSNASAKVQVVYGCADGSLVEGGPGSSCRTNFQCASGVCSAGVCVGTADNKPSGSPCVTGTECASGSCQGGLCEGGGDGKAPGEACTTHSECTSQVCQNGTCAPGIG